MFPVSPKIDILRYITQLLMSRSSLFPTVSWRKIKTYCENECLQVVNSSVSQVSDDTRLQQNWHYRNQQILPHLVFQHIDYRKGMVLTFSSRLKIYPHFLSFLFPVFQYAHVSDSHRLNRQLFLTRSNVSIPSDIRSDLYFFSLTTVKTGGKLVHHQWVHAM